MLWILMYFEWWVLYLCLCIFAYETLDRCLRKDDINVLWMMNFVFVSLFIFTNYSKEQKPYWINPGYQQNVSVLDFDLVWMIGREILWRIVPTSLGLKYLGLKLVSLQWLCAEGILWIKKWCLGLSFLIHKFRLFFGLCYFGFCKKLTSRQAIPKG